MINYKTGEVIQSAMLLLNIKGTSPEPSTKGVMNVSSVTLQVDMLTDQDVLRGFWLTANTARVMGLADLMDKSFVLPMT